MRRFSVSRFWDVVRDHRRHRDPRHRLDPGPAAQGAARPARPQHKVKRALQVAVPANLHREMTERWGFPWVDGYGHHRGRLRHPRAAGRTPTRWSARARSGIAVPEVDAAAGRRRRRGRAAGATGEFLIAAPGHDARLPQPPRGDRRGACAGGWFRTGDLGRQDERGFLYFMGRKKDIIRRSGENLAAAEVEDVLRAHPKVLEAAVIPVPDELRGEEVKAYVLPVDGRDAETDPARGAGRRAAPTAWPGTRCRATSSTGPPTSRGPPRCGCRRRCCASQPVVRSKVRSGTARTRARCLPPNPRPEGGTHG